MSLQPVSTKDCDFLDQDPALRGQNFVCMSFLSPEDVLRNKDISFVSAFVSGIGKQLEDLFAGLEQKYPDDKQLLNTMRENHSHFFTPDALQAEYKVFLDMNSADLEKKFYEANEFRTSIRGFKVRGTYDTYVEAANRAQALKKGGDKFDIFVAQVGCWCPWSPNPSDLENQEYAETQLNTLMKGYQENNKQKDTYYEMRKQEILETAKKDLEERKQKLEELKEAEAVSNNDVDAVQDNSKLENFLNSEDPWTAAKNAEAEADV